MPADIPEKSLRGSCYGADNTPESAAFAEFRRTCLAVMVRLKEALPDEYDLLEQTERAEIRFFWMLRRHRLTVIFLAKLETRFRRSLWYTCPNHGFHA